MKKQEFKIEERLMNLWDNFKCFNFWIIGVPGGEEEAQEIEILFEKITKEPWLVWLSGLSAHLWTKESQFGSQ